jgi:hypothetical protein
MARCACGNVAESEGLCSWCLPHVDCVAPEGVRPYLARWTGEPRWECVDCGHVWACLDCVCEASHDCAHVLSVTVS